MTWRIDLVYRDDLKETYFSDERPSVYSGGHYIIKLKDGSQIGFHPVQVKNFTFTEVKTDA